MVAPTASPLALLVPAAVACVEGAWEAPGCLAASSSARSLSTCIAPTMKLCQISAGKVPPSTGPPSYSVSIGTRLLGKPTHTATV